MGEPETFVEKTILLVVEETGGWGILKVGIVGEWACGVGCVVGGERWLFLDLHCRKTSHFHLRIEEAISVLLRLLVYLK